MGGIGGFGYTMVSSMLTVFAAACRMFVLDMVMVCFRGWIVCCDTGEWYKLFGVLYQGSFKFWFGRPRLARRGRGESIVGWGDLVWLAEVVESQNLKVPLSTTLKHKQPFTTAHHSSQPLTTALNHKLCRH